MKIRFILTAIVTVILLSACGEAPKIGNIGIPGGSTNVSTNKIGINNQLSYLSSAVRDEACNAQAQIITGAGYKAIEEPSVNDTYTRTTYSDDKSELTLMCSEEKDGATYIGTKITLTLMEKKNSLNR